MPKSQAIKTYFSTESRPVELAELSELIKGDRPGYDQLARLCAQALGVELDGDQPAA